MASQHVEAIVLISLHIAIVAGVGIRVVLGRHAPGSSFAWLLLTAVLPGIWFKGYRRRRLRKRRGWRRH